MTNLDNINFRYMDHSFLLVKNIDFKTRMIIEKSGFRIRQDDNAMLVYGYIDHTAGLSFELMCAACVFDDGSVSFEPASKDTSFKFRYGSFQGDVEQFTDRALLAPYMERAEMINDGYKCNNVILEVRDIVEVDPSRAPGYPDDIVVFFIKEGYRNEGIWCRVEDADREKGVLKMRMLNQPNAPFGKNYGDIVDVALVKMDDGELKAIAVL